VDIPDPFFGYGGYYGYGLAGSKATVAAALGTDIGAIAQYDVAQGNSQGAAEAEAAQHRAAAVAALPVAAAGGDSAVLVGAKWDQQVITWSLAGSPGPAGAPFSDYMGPGQEAAAEDAFAAWGAASGLTFEEVADSAQSDIRIGWGSFNTASSGIAGVTNLQGRAGQITGAVIRLEDPNQDPLTAASGGAPTYAGTQATFLQVLEHEIGHALGLSDDADPHSIMYYAAGAGNRALDATDTAGAQALYGNDAASLLVQAIASVPPPGGTASVPPTPPPDSAAAAIASSTH
jgi:hypothetical protein